MAISKERRNSLTGFQKKLNIRFNDIELLNLAFYHRSVLNEIGKNSSFHCNCNERLEFLGDTVLDLVVASFLYNEFPSYSEGQLSQIKSVVVSEPSLAEVALNLDYSRLLVLGHGEELSGGRKKKAILADCVEAVFGAYYLDQGFSKVQDFILRIIGSQIKKVVNNHGQKDYKTQLQELFQKKFKKVPLYELVKTEGPEHDKRFWVSVHLGDRTVGPVMGSTKKEAEQNAARLALDSD